MIDILLLIICIGILVAFLPSIMNPICNAPPIPSPAKHRRWVCAQLAHLGPAKTVVEVGSGWGGLTSKLARLPNITNLIAVEMSPILACICKVRLPAKVRVMCTDITSAQGKTILSNANVIVIYGFKELNAKIVDALSPGTYVLSITFPFPKLTLLESKKIARTTSFLYKV